MKNVLLHEAIKRNGIRKRWQLWKKVVGTMGLLVVFCTVYALVLPAITMADDAVCGMEVHEHTPSCYRTQIVTAACPAAQHIHDGCEDSLGNFTCGFGKVLLHSHGDNCYDAQQNLICPLEERTEHLHSDGCFDTIKTLTCPQDEQEGHIHTVECYTFETNLTCQLEQVAIHTHTADCWDADGNRICNITPAAVHVHDEGCFSVIQLDQPELICPLEEHTHVESCYIEAFGSSTAAKEFRCGFGVHQHEDACYDEAGNLICSIPAHTHDASCKLEGYDPTADVETAADWEATFANMELTGNWPLDILSIAKTQEGYHESLKNAYLYEDGSLKGYTRYGEWFGAPYIDWSAMFVSFCAHYAGAQALPQDASCAGYMSKMELGGMLHKPGYYLPKPGDLVFFDRNYTTGESVTPDHMGIVAELLLDDNGELTKVKVLAGDIENEVQYTTYDMMDASIVGYGAVPDGERLRYTCGIDGHAHTADCYEWKVHYTDDNMLVQAIIRGTDTLPEDLSLEVNRITAANDPLSYESMSAALNDRITDTPYFMSQTGIYRMRLLSDGAAYELPQGAVARVKVTFTQPIFSSQAVKNAAKMQTFLLTPDAPAAQAVEPRAAAPYRLAARSVENAYQAEALDGESYQSAGDGLTGVEFETTEFATFAVVLSTHTMTDRFWTRVTDTSELASGGTFMIVSAEGNYALRGNNSNNYTPITLEAVKGNTQYYTITSSSGIDANLYWTFSGSGTRYVVQNQQTSQYVSLTRVNEGSYWRPNYKEYVVKNSSATLTMSYQTTEKCWRFQNGSYFLRNAGTGAFGITDANDGKYNNNTIYYYTRDMLIFKLSDVTTLEIPEDVTNRNNTSEEGDAGPAKPNYGDFIVPSTSQTGSTAVTDQQGGTVSGSYFSDPSTSDIETQFRKDSYEDSQIIDGKVVTDKSVIYGKDDYGAFGSYAGNTFSVTLSTLGQEYPVPEQHQVKVPVDVVFVLDVSGSMSTEGEEGRHSQRAVDMANAVNTAIGRIMEDHEENRIGVVLYSGGAWEMLPLSRYTASNGQYVIYEKRENVKHSPTNYEFDITYVLGGDTLKDQYTGKSYAGVGGDAVQGIGTYTQAGIAMGHKVFHDIGDDTTYTTTMGEGESERTYTVSRQPVFILLSDGEPTYSTNVYNDVLNGPHYGDGYGGTPNGKGIHGYNTILSANYYKRMVGIQYQRPALFYTVGMSISATDDKPMIPTSYTSDTYKRAVLNPTVDMITNMTSTHSSASYTVEQLKSLLLGNYTDQYVDTRSQWPEKWTGIPHINVPVLHENPYADDYSYANGAYFGNLDETALTEIFDDIYLQSSNIYLYGFILYRDSSVDIVDRIGAGMEIKGTPVLRYGGQNYTDPEITVNGNVTTYTYRGTFTDPYIPDRTVDLSRIRITVTTEENGDQVVDFYVPDTALPVYTPELIGQQYYYESLPARLIYQVGLTAESEQAVLNLQKTGGKLTFYTNKWETDDLISTSTLLPSTFNPFYYDSDGDGSIPPYQPHHTLKTENTTDTVDYHVDCTRTIDTHNGETVVRVIHKQGNNGKLVYESDVVDIPVEKVWDGTNADLMNPVEITLYKVTDMALESGGVRRYAQKVATGQLDGSNNWSYVFQDMPAPAEDWYYAIAETVPAGYRVSYSGENIEIIIGDSQPTTAAKVGLSDTQIPTVTVTNRPGVRLPATGGFDTIPYTMGGMLLMIAACSALLYRMTPKRRKEDRPSS